MCARALKALTVMARGAGQSRRGDFPLDVLGHGLVVKGALHGKQVVVVECFCQAETLLVTDGIWVSARWRRRRWGATGGNSMDIWGQPKTCSKSCFQFCDINQLVNLVLQGLGKNLTMFSDTCSFGADGLCIGSPWIVGGKNAGNSNMQEFLLHYAVQLSLIML